MVGHSKFYLRTNFSHNYTKIVHKGDWLARVKTACGSACDCRSKPGNFTQNPHRTVCFTASTQPDSKLYKVESRYNTNLLQL